MEKGVAICLLLVSEVAQIREAALQLSEKERLELTAALLDSIEKVPNEEWQAAWFDEVRKRLADYKANGDTASEWTDAHARIRAES